ncbi:MAG: hypothetical protein V3V05_04940 [Pontiella sp.]
MKDPICNRGFETFDGIEEKISEALKPYWEDPSYALKLVGDGWLHTQANATRLYFIPECFDKWYNKTSLTRKWRKLIWRSTHLGTHKSAPRAGRFHHLIRILN